MTLLLSSCSTTPSHHHRHPCFSSPPPTRRPPHQPRTPTTPTNDNNNRRLPPAAGGGRGGSNAPDGSKSLSQLEREVPPDQRPVNELQQLKDSLLYSWATLDSGAYSKRLIILWGGVFTLLSGPIAYQTFDPLYQPIEFFLSASTGSLLVVAVASLRIYLGWKYVADRLMTATLEYEETGWYDGQQFVKPPEILTRDRLLGRYEVLPVMQRLKRTLQGTGVALLATAFALTAVVKTDADGMYGRGAALGGVGATSTTRVTPDGILFSNKVNSLRDLIADDDLAAAEQAAQGGVPGYCRDRYFKALANGESVCDKFEREQRRNALLSRFSGLGGEGSAQED